MKCISNNLIKIRPSPTEGDNGVLVVEKDFYYEYNEKMITAVVSFGMARSGEQNVNLIAL